MGRIMIDCLSVLLDAIIILFSSIFFIFPCDVFFLNGSIRFTGFVF